MCGITGLFDSRGRRDIDRKLLVEMNDSLIHRGPDGDGIYCAPGLGLGHRRLSIIDLSGGAQPMFSDDESVAVVFNGEIYNFQILQKELESIGHRFKTKSDTEVIIRAWEQWGPESVERLRGMFAYALWDANKETLFIARDRLGKKPLYYTVLDDGLVAFGSELKALMRHPALKRTINPQAVEDYFALGYVPDPICIFEGVHKLPPAHAMVWRRGEDPVMRQYWTLTMSEDGPQTMEDAADSLREQLAEAVSLRMISDVPLGAFLSGGVDSSGVVASMAEQSDRPVNTFSIGFGDKAFDESGFAQQVADRYETNHQMRIVDPTSFDLVDRLANMYDEPFGDSSSMPTFRVCAAARERVTVALSGDGGDEVFAGYRRYLWHAKEEQIRGMMPSGLRRPLFGTLGRLYPKFDWLPRPLRFKTTFQELALDADEGYFNNISVVSDQLRESIFANAFKRTLAGYRAIEHVHHAMDASQTDNPLLRAQYADIKTYLPGDILVKVDRASMASSLEVRAPLLDHKLVEWGSSLPAKLKLSGTERKAVLKKAFEPLVPHDLLYRPKQGFSIPISSWFRGPLRQRVMDGVTGSTMRETGIFDMQALSRLVDQHQSGLRDHGAALWVLLMFESFLRNAGLSAEN